MGADHMKPRQPERAEQEAVKRLLLTIGAKFWVAGTVRKKGDHPGTMQTPGLADMPLVFLPIKNSVRQLVVIEVKSPKAAKTKSGGLRPEQRELQVCCWEAGVPYIHGDLDAVIAWLVEHEYVKASQFPHYRVTP